MGNTNSLRAVSIPDRDSVELKAATCCDRKRNAVSIPDRDSVELKDNLSWLDSAKHFVSIPDRDSVELKGTPTKGWLIADRFQSLIGIQLN